MNGNMPGFLIHHQLLELAQTHVHWVGDAIQPLLSILCRPLLFLPSTFRSIRVFSKESVLCVRWPKYWSFSFSISPPNEYSGLINWFDFLAVQGLIHVKSQYLIYGQFLSQHQQLCQSDSLNLLILATVLNLQIARIIVSVVVHLLSCVWGFSTPWTAENQASLSFTISQSFLKFLSIELVMPYNHLILCRPLLILPLIFPTIRVFSNELALCIRWPKYWSFSISPSNEYLGLISWILIFQFWISNIHIFRNRINEYWYSNEYSGLTDLISLQPKGLPRIFSNTKFKNINSSAFSLLYGLTFTSIHDYWKSHSFDYMDRCSQSNISAI